MWDFLKDALGNNYHSNDIDTMAKKHTPKKSAVASKKSTAVKKAPAKKRATKKSASTKKVKATSKKRTQKKKPLARAEGEQQFYAANGAVLSTLNELLDELSRMDDDSFYCHIRGERNDFACWVNDVLCDEECARELLEANDRPETITVLKTTLKTYDV